MYDARLECGFERFETDAGSDRQGDVDVVFGHGEKPFLHENVEHRFTIRRTELPETLGLRQRQPQPGHFPILTADTIEQR